MGAGPDILLLGGPTASGKTALGLHAARRLGAEIVNADSMQVYSGLRILTARPTDAEMEGVPHHLFGVIDPAERCSVGRWSRMALAALVDIRARGKRAVFVGGTGLYFKALTEGLVPTPEIPDAVRAAVRELAETGDAEALRAEAQRLDPTGAASVEAGDRQRLIRLIEVARAAGRPLSALQAETAPPIPPDAWRGVVLQPPRDALYERIEARFDAMMDEGALDEARAIAGRDLDPDLPAMKAVGLPPLLAHLRGETDLDEAVRLARRDTRRYAKRQFTWFSNQHPGWARIAELDPDAARAELDRILDEEFAPC
ncbi:tRNA (adenosine(37)-N6)-dimethylallyltransferase MiaA [Marinicauda salina]|uniref:tRNA dimethylallyltransferase n=1 Tax=Marinicauda salina TaxID=2135793 RepID=A0A2U2BSS0_9PROT|nr:tRNA (adenosine(37)-N6)-dimethylallyltransferase MiaA [Marinicauda salina]PWE17052.1 tRNA (adenosine(37)-N6)-dimethylallyltransferase MiaA [Marinicauda salina]